MSMEENGNNIRLSMANICDEIANIARILSGALRKTT
jgi:F420-0:gamma-glutamyl ligase